MSTAGIFWSRRPNLCLSVVMLPCTKFRVNQIINRPDIAENDFHYGCRLPCWICKIVALCHVTVLGSVTCGCTLNCAEIGWFPSAILNLQNFSILLSNRLWKHNLHPHTKFHLNRMIFGWDIAIKPFSKWRPSAILNFRNSVFWSYHLC